MTIQTRPIIERFMREFLPSFARADQAFIGRLRQLENYRIQGDVDALLEPFTKPVVIITGRHDTEVGFAEAYQLARGYPRATFAVSDGASHGVFLEQEEGFTPLMKQWLSRVKFLM